MASVQKERSLRPLTNESGAEILEVGVYLAIAIVGAIVLLTPIGAAITGAFTAVVAAL